MWQPPLCAPVQSPEPLDVQILFKLLYIFTQIRYLTQFLQIDQNEVHLLKFQATRCVNENLFVRNITQKFFVNHAGYGHQSVLWLFLSQ